MHKQERNKWDKVDDNYYQGEKNIHGQRHGLGVVSLPNGDFYMGEWQYDQVIPSCYFYDCFSDMVMVKQLLVGLCQKSQKSTFRNGDLTSLSMSRDNQSLIL